MLSYTSSSNPSIPHSYSFHGNAADVFYSEGIGASIIFLRYFSWGGLPTIAITLFKQKIFTKCSFLYPHGDIPTN